MAIEATGSTAGSSGAQQPDSGQGGANKKSAVQEDPLAKKETFLKLLVAQIKNQNPLNPADGVEFLSQLAQFTQLEQMLEIRAELKEIKDAIKPPSDSAQETGGSTQTAEAH